METRKILIRHARLIDGNGNCTENCDLLVEGERIKRIGQSLPMCESVSVLDATGKTVMPGLIDGHTHFSVFATTLATRTEEFLGKRYATVVRNLNDALKYGCTAACDCGGLETGFVQAQMDGIIDGPRLKSCVTQIRSYGTIIDDMPGVGGAFSPITGYQRLPGFPNPYAVGPEECRKKVREMIMYGASIIKVINENIISYPWVNTQNISYKLDEMQAIVDEAHNAGLKVTCHVASPETLKMAIAANVDCIDHASYADEKDAEEIIKKGIYVNFSVGNMIWYIEKNPKLNESMRKMRSLTYTPSIETAREFFRSTMLPPLIKSINMFYRLGGAHLITMAPDINGGESGGTGMVSDMKAFVEAGMTPMEAIVASTSNVAKYLDWYDLIGSLEEGKAADLLIVDGNPLDDISILGDTGNLLLVMQAGRPVSGQFMRLLPYEKPVNLTGWTF